ncbi:hypothetical protein [Blastococcus sp. TF02A-26]|uniref:hypothetical protein n=1 Tax=Blastococcus sp. TF02A-26 TaxID=2250577 RepID=UPI000DEBF9EF|nr:hypothetical protein [Blastococcus sp. TF02A-26]RBY82695.1 hypothetical protein DQ240_18550 [Blastococcus sp. TF02A-26]
MTAALQAPAAPMLDELAARRITNRIRETLQVAVDLLIEAWSGRVWEPLGHGSWEDYLAAEFGDLNFRLPAEPRQERLLTMRQAGMSVRAIKATPGAGSAGTVAGDLKVLRAAGRLDDSGGVTSLDGRRRPGRATSRPTSAPEISPADTVADQAVAWVAAAGARGLTVHELCDRAGWRQGKASAALSRVHRQRRVGVEGRFRGGCTVYVQR